MIPSSKPAVDPQVRHTLRLDEVRRSARKARILLARLFVVWARSRLAGFDIEGPLSTQIVPLRYTSPFLQAVQFWTTVKLGGEDRCPTSWPPALPELSRYCGSSRKSSARLPTCGSVALPALQAVGKRL